MSLLDLIAYESSFVVISDLTRLIGYPVPVKTKWNTVGNMHRTYGAFLNVKGFKELQLGRIAFCIDNQAH